MRKEVLGEGSYAGGERASGFGDVSGQLTLISCVTDKRLQQANLSHIPTSPSMVF